MSYAIIVLGYTILSAKINKKNESAKRFAQKRQKKKGKKFEQLVNYGCLYRKRIKKMSGVSPCHNLFISASTT